MMIQSQLVNRVSVPGKAVIILFGIEVKPADMAIFPYTPPTITTSIPVSVILIHVEIVKLLSPLETAEESCCRY